MTQPNELHTWSQTLRVTLRAAEELPHRLEELTALPAGGDPVERLRSLRELLDARGLNLEAFRKCPLWMFEHGKCDYWQMPIGLAEDPQTKRLCVDQTAERLIATCFFHQGIRQVEEIFSLVAAKVLRAASVGFIPLRLD
jgi:hypothetical protein